MNDDELRNRLARRDPQADAPVDPITSPRAQDLLERTMATSTDTLPETQSPDPRRSRLLMALAAGVAAAGIVTAVVLSSDGGSTPIGRTQKSTLALNLPGGGGPSLGSCIRFSVEFLKQEPLAFAGTVTAVDADTVTLDVTKWFKGGTAQQVTLSSGGRGITSVPDTTFESGKDYLVSASEGTVASCGFSGEDTAELRAAYDQAFG